MFDQNEFKKYATKHVGISSLTYDNYVSAITPGIRNLTPNIIEERQLNVSVLDVFSRLMMDRIIFLGTGINDQVANIVQAQLLFLESVDAKKDIQIYLNSPGGSVYAGLGIYDTMQIIKPDVATICTGMAASMGAVNRLSTTRLTPRMPLGKKMAGAAYTASSPAGYVQISLKVG